MGESSEEEIDSQDDISTNKTQILQDAKQFFMGTSVKTKKLVEVLTKCLFIILHGENLSNEEATELFFHITRLFQYKNKDSTLRRLIYIGIKALARRVDNVFVVAPSLSTDISSFKDDPVVLASTLRVLCQISDASTISSIEQHLKQTVVHKDPVVASAALTSLLRISQSNLEIVKRCSSELDEAMNSESPMVQYHALALQYASHKDDRPATARLLSSCLDRDLKSPLAICFLLKILAIHIKDAPDSEDMEKYASFIRDCLDHQSDIVEYEAASTIVSLAPRPEQHKVPAIKAANVFGDISAESSSASASASSSSSSSTSPSSTKLHKLQVSNAITHLRNFLSATKPVLRFASVRLLNQLSDTSMADIRFWSVHRVGTLCKLHLLNKRYKPGDEIIGVLDFSNSSVICAKYSCSLHCDEFERTETIQEFSIGFKQRNFMITIPQIKVGTNGTTLHCVLSFLFHITDKDFPKTLYEDRAGSIELGPETLETKPFSCDFPMAIYIN